jgi:hypothetical protein
MLRPPLGISPIRHTSAAARRGPASSSCWSPTAPARGSRQRARMPATAPPRKGSGARRSPRCGSTHRPRRRGRARMGSETPLIAVGEQPTPLRQPCLQCSQVSAMPRLMARWRTPSITDRRSGRRDSNSQHSAWKPRAPAGRKTQETPGFPAILARLGRFASLRTASRFFASYGGITTLVVVVKW